MSAGLTMDTVYDPHAVEPGVYAEWERSGAFRAPTEPAAARDRTYCIVMPPPNVTGALHLGHALNNTLQDILIRYHRMRGFHTLWQPGTDHAGIATQAVVERRIRETEGNSRHQLGDSPESCREELVRRIWLWKDEYERRIVGQLKLMGCSADWERNRFTLDEGLARAVRHMFFNLFRDGLIFRGKRLVNWDTELQTAVADDEIYYETVKGHFWHIRYPVIDPNPGEPASVVIATTRPETMLADTAVAVHPDPARALNERERGLREELAGETRGALRAEIEEKLKAIAARRETHLPQLVRLAAMARDGRMVRLPLMERAIPLIADEWADPMLGSGCVKITPAHDPNDYEVGQRHGLAMINALTPDGKIAAIVEPDADSAPVEPGNSTNANSARYAGLSFSDEGRRRVVADLEAAGLLEAVEDRETEVGHSDRSKTAIEPYLSDQWFVTTAAAPQNAETPKRRNAEIVGTGLAQAAMAAVEDERVRVIPERYAKSYLDWLGEKRDWCISRQLWWGHRIPIWTEELPLPNQIKGAEGIGIHAIERMRGMVFVAPFIQATPHLPQHAHLDFGIKDQKLVACWSEEPSPEERQFLADNDVTQDPDVLDTWFSSALWPFSTLGWPEETAHLRQYYPGRVLVTSRDIITNWVARMVMFGLYAMGEVPFDHVYIHPKILDGRGETMSKSKGNGVDPVDIIHMHGADALRYTMADMCTETQDIRMPVDYVCPHCGKLTEQSLALKAEEQHRKSRGIRLERKLQPADCEKVRCVHKECGKDFATQWAPAELKSELSVARETSEKFEIGRNFCNKLWNAARFAFMNLEGAPCDALPIAELAPEDRWILARLSQTIREYHSAIKQYQFSASVKILREFFWDSLCDWYIELTKPRVSGQTGETAQATARQVLAFCLDQVLRLFHPTIPFITERLWAQLNASAPRRGLPGIVDLSTDRPLVLAEFPPVEGYVKLDDAAIVDTFADLQDATRGVRDLRVRCHVGPKQAVTVTVVTPAGHAEAFRAQSHIVRHMAGIDTLHVVEQGKRPPNAGSIAVRHLRIYVHDISDDAAERTRSQQALEALAKQIAGKESKLNNPGFMAKADPALVETERTKLAELLAQRTALAEHLAELQ